MILKMPHYRRLGPYRRFDWYPYRYYNRRPIPYYDNNFLLVRLSDLY